MNIRGDNRAAPDVRLHGYPKLRRASIETSYNAFGCTEYRGATALRSKTPEVVFKRRYEVDVLEPRPRSRSLRRQK